MTKLEVLQLLHTIILDSSINIINNNHETFQIILLKEIEEQLQTAYRENSIHD